MDGSDTRSPSRAARILRLTVATMAVALVVVLGAPGVAFATGPLTPPDSYGSQMVCRVTWNAETQVTSGTTEWTSAVQAKCNYSSNLTGSSDFNTSNPMAFSFTNNGTQTWWTGSPGAGQSCPARPAPTSPVRPAHPMLVPAVNNTAGARNRQDGGCSNVNGAMPTVVPPAINSNGKCRYWFFSSWNTDCRIESVVQTWAAPDQYPNDYYTGGVAGTAPLPNPPAPAPACSRSLDVGLKVAHFTNATPTVTGAADTYSWNYGDASTASTVASPTHTYSAALPDGGWTAVLTITRTGDGVTYANTTTTATCSLRVDFANPDQSTAGTTGSTATPDDTNCPTSAWGFLNPLAFVSTLKCLFVPPAGDWSFSAFKTQFQDSALSVPTGGLGAVKGSFDAMKEGVDYARGTNGLNQIHQGFTDCQGPELNLPVPGIGATPSGDQAGAVWLENGHFHMRPLYACDGVMQMVATKFRAIARVVIWLMAAGALSALWLKGLFGFHGFRGGRDEPAEPSGKKGAEVAFAEGRGPGKRVDWGYS
jgi:hypothetical protein